MSWERNISNTVNLILLIGSKLGNYRLLNEWLLQIGAWNTHWYLFSKVKYASRNKNFYITPVPWKSKKYEFSIVRLYLPPLPPLSGPCQMGCVGLGVSAEKIIMAKIKSTSSSLAQEKCLILKRLSVWVTHWVLRKAVKSVLSKKLSYYSWQVYISTEYWQMKNIWINKRRSVLTNVDVSDIKLNML